MQPRGEPRDLAACRPVVLGSEGRAGRVISTLLAEIAPQCIAATRVELDITDYFNLCWEFERLKTDLVINAAAWTDVDGCEADPGRALAINATGALNVARAAAVCGAQVVHLSTDYVFDGLKGEPYSEEDEPAPLSAYGRSKVAGELAVLADQRDALIIRTAWLFGGVGRRPDFVDRILAAAQTTDVIPVIAGQRGSPTAVRDLAESLIALLFAGARGLVHVACAGDTDRVGLATAILEEAGLSSVRVVPVPAGPDHAGAPRPEDSRLNVARLEALAGIRPRPWREALREVVAERRLS